jgi:antitoxin component YwqK of YwqJK toxin-antitoxin module
MKPYLSIILLLYFFTDCTAQQVSFGLPKMNVIYRGLDNPLTVAVEGYLKKQLVVTSVGCEVIDSGETYIIRAHGNVRECMVKVGVKEKNKTRWVDSMRFRCRPLPTPEPSFGTLNSEFNSLPSVRATNVMYASMGAGFAVEGISYIVDSFSYLFYDGYNFEIGKNIGPFVDEDLKKTIRSMHEGGFIYFFDIYCHSPAISWSHQKTADLLLKTRKKSGTHPKSYSPENIEIEGFFRDSNKVVLLKYPGVSDELSRFIGLKKTGLWKFYVNDLCGGYLHSEMEYGQNGKIKWNSMYYSNDSLFREVTYSDTSASQFRDYYDNGKLKRSGGFVENDSFEFSGIYDETAFLNILHDTGSVRWYNSVGLFRDIQLPLNGYWKFYHENGKMKAEGNFILTVNENIIVMYGSSGEPDKPKRWYQSVKQGIWKIYNENGRLTAEIEYNKGWAVKTTEH